MQKWIRVGLWGLPLCALLYMLTTPMRGEWLAPEHADFDRWINSPGFQLYGVAAMNATVIGIFGLLGLFAWLDENPRDRRLNFFGAAFSVAGAATLLPILGIIAIEWPFIGDHGTAGVAADTVASPVWLVWVTFSAASFAIGSICYGVVLWRRGQQGPGFVYAVGGATAGIPFWFALELFGVAMWTLGAFWIAVVAWRDQSRPTKPESPAP